MRQQPGQESESPLILHLWTYAEAVNALPYLRSVARSVRRHWLAVQSAQRRLQRMDARPGRPDRQALILRAEAAREVERAGADLEEAVRELSALDVRWLDPLQGLALIPFRQGDELAWFVFDLFSPKGVEAWLSDADSPETRRALPEAFDPGWWQRLRSAAIDVLMLRGTQAVEEK